MARGRKFRRGGAVRSKSEKGKPTPDSKPEHVGTPAMKVVKNSMKKVAKGKKSLQIRKKGGFNKQAVAEQIMDFAGLIFMCNTETKNDCFQYHVFGFPEAKKDIVEKARKGMKLFLFDIDEKVLHGVYKASSNGGMNLVSEAFQGSERKFPAQIRFRILKHCAPLDESDFKPVLKDNYFGRNKFRCELSSEQVGKLSQLFRPLDANGLPKAKLTKTPKFEPALHKVSTSRGLQSGAPGRDNIPNPRQLPAGLYPMSLIREPFPGSYVPHSQATYTPDFSRLDADVLYRQRLEAQERRPYALDPVLDASLRQIGGTSEIFRRRFPELSHADDRSLLPPKGEFLYKDLYSEMPYSREALYGGRDDGLALRGNLPYRPLSSLPWGYP